MSDIGKRIRILREKKGLSQEELAHLMGYASKTTITKIETGVNDIPQNKIVRFAECLDTSPAALMGWVEQKESEKNDALADIVLKLRKDEELFSMVKKLATIDPSKRPAVNAVLDAFAVDGK